MLACAAGAALAGQMPVAFDEVLELPSRTPAQTIRYGRDASQSATLWLPPGRGTHPLVVLVHGGCWLVEYDEGHLRPLAARLARDGYAVYLPEYRRVGEAGGGWPGSPADLVRALDALAAGRHPRLALDRTVLAGHSAGGHLALWLAAREAALWRPPLRIVAALGLAAITDLETYARGDNSCETVTPRFMGGAPEEAPARYAQASPAALDFDVPVALLWGTEDHIVRSAQASALSRARLLRLDGAGHFDWIHPETPAYDVLRDTLFELLRDALGSASP